MKIRRYQPGDRDAVIALWTDCELVRPWNDPQKDINRKLADSAELFFVGTDNDRIIATIMVGYEGHRGWVNYLAVSPQSRGQGLGRELMTHAEQVLLEMKCPKLNLQVRETNTAVLEFYRSIGYEVDAAVSLGKRLIPDN